MIDAAPFTLACPRMAITFDGVRHWLTSLEPMTLNVTFADGSALSFFVTIPPTLVSLHLAWVPDIATVASCSGAGGDGAGNSFVVNLPQEPVVVEMIGGKLAIVAKQIPAPAMLRRADGATWKGIATFPDCVVSGGHAAPVVATGTLTQVGGVHDRE